jgi:hypothetical protein
MTGIVESVRDAVLTSYHYSASGVSWHISTVYMLECCGGMVLRSGWDSSAILMHKRSADVFSTVYLTSAAQFTDSRYLNQLALIFKISTQLKICLLSYMFSIIFLFPVKCILKRSLFSIKKASVFHQLLL